MKILITGGAGFIGSHIAEHYRNENVTVLDNLRTGFLPEVDLEEGLKKTIEFFRNIKRRG